MGLSLPLEVTDIRQGRLEGKRCTKPAEVQEHGQTHQIQGMGSKAFGLLPGISMSHESGEAVCAHISQGWQSPRKHIIEFYNGNWGKIY